MVEIWEAAPRLWLELPDPLGSQEEPEVVYRIDLTWLASRWNCIFGRGCPGIFADRPDDGCCTLGAHYSGAEDQARVESLAATLDDGHWQHRQTGLAGGVSELDDEGEPRTRRVDGACIFLNRPGFAGGIGCALHHMAVQRGLPLTETKPDVCWQLPLRRSYEDAVTADGREYLVTVIGEYDRRGWGPGGRDLDWYCTSATEAHSADQPVYLSLRDELVALLGPDAYDLVAAQCAALAPGTTAPHPATAQHLPASGRLSLLPVGAKPLPGSPTAHVGP